MNTLIDKAEILSNSVSLQDTIMLIRVTIHKWGAKRYDKTVTNQIAVHHDVKADAGKFYKVLIKAPEFKAYDSATSALSNKHQSLTSPWGDDGQRALNNQVFPDWRENFNHLMGDVEQAKRDILANYEQRKAEAKIYLKDMFNEADYPSLDELARKFGVTYEIWPASDSTDWRFDFGKESNSELVDLVANQMTSRFKGIAKDAWERIEVVLKHYVDRLEDPTTTFNSSMVEKGQDLIDILPYLNFMDDPELTKISDQMRAKMYMYTPDTLRYDLNIRSAVVDEAKDMLDKLPGLMGCKLNR